MVLQTYATSPSLCINFMHSGLVQKLLILQPSDQRQDLPHELVPGQENYDTQPVRNHYNKNDKL
jgi:hypothetical protein